jgi:hypothetical protein
LPFQFLLIARQDPLDNPSFGLGKDLDKFAAVEETYNSILSYPTTKVPAFHFPGKLGQLLILVLA